MISITVITLILLLVTNLTSETEIAGKLNFVKQLNKNVYECTFHIKVNCQWKSNDGLLNIANFNYKYTNKDNGKSTTDCSIEGPPNFDSSYISCFGIVQIQTIYVQKGSSVELPCRSKNNSKCSWKRNKALIDEDVRYKYRDIHYESSVCSLLITSVKDIDIGYWSCSTKVNDENSEAILLGEYKLLPSSGSLMQSKSYITSTTSTNSVISSTTEKNGAPTGELSLSLIIIIATTNVVLAGVIIGLVVFVCKHYNHQRQESQNKDNKKDYEERQSVEDTNQRRFRSSAVSELPSIPETGDSDDSNYLVPVVTTGAVAVNYMNKLKLKPDSSRSPNYIKHLYETIEAD